MISYVSSKEIVPLIKTWTYKKIIILMELITIITRGGWRNSVVTIKFTWSLVLHKALFQSYDLLHRQLNGSQFSIVLPLYSVSNDCSHSIPPVNHVSPPQNSHPTPSDVIITNGTKAAHRVVKKMSQRSLDMWSMKTFIVIIDVI